GWEARPSDKRQACWALSRTPRRCSRQRALQPRTLRVARGSLDVHPHRRRPSSALLLPCRRRRSSRRSFFWRHLQAWLWCPSVVFLSPRSNRNLEAWHWGGARWWNRVWIIGAARHGRWRCRETWLGTGILLGWLHGRQAWRVVRRRLFATRRA